jgi:hypothetical protein
VWRINLFEILPFLAAVIFLIAIVAFARRRASRNYPSRNRTDRVWHTATIFALLTMVIAAFSFFRRFFLVDALFNSLLWLAGAGLTGLLWGWAVDWFLMEMGAVRNRFWLVVSMAIFAAGFALLVLVPISLWIGSYPTFDMIPVVINASAAGAWWWSYGQAETSIREVFE